MVENEPVIVTFYCYSKKIINDVNFRVVLMNTKTLLGISFAAVFATTMIFAQSAQAGVGWMQVEDSSITTKGATTSLMINATGSIPRDAGEGVLFGFGWFYDGATTSDSVFAVTTHNPVRDSHQNPDKWHVHNVVAGASSDDAIADACIVSLSGYVQSGITIQGDIMTINTPVTALSGELNDGAGAFFIVNSDTACPGVTLLADGTPSGLNLGVKFVV